MSQEDIFELASSDSDSEKIHSVDLDNLTSSGEDEEQTRQRQKNARERKRFLTKIKAAEAEYDKCVEAQNKKFLEKKKQKKEAAKPKSPPKPEERSGNAMLTPAQRMAAMDNVDEIFDKASKEIAVAVVKSMKDSGLDAPTKGAALPQVVGRVPAELA